MDIFCVRYWADDLLTQLHSALAAFLSFPFPFFFVFLYVDFGIQSLPLDEEAPALHCTALHSTATKKLSRRGEEERREEEMNLIGNCQSWSDARASFDVILKGNDARLTCCCLPSSFTRRRPPPSVGAAFDDAVAFCRRRSRLIHYFFLMLSSLPVRI